MARLLILGATGSLGRHVLREALAAKHDVTVFVRAPSKLNPDDRRRLAVHVGDLDAGLPSEILAGQEGLINCAGHVKDGAAFVALVDRIVTSVERVSDPPVCWFVAGAALLDINGTGRRPVDLPAVASTYWPHAANFDRLTRSTLDWRLLCPGPIVEGPALGRDRLRVSLDRLPVDIPSPIEGATDSERLSMFPLLLSQMIVAYADAAAVMLANLDRGSVMSRHRVGLALPVGMRGYKP